MSTDKVPRSTRHNQHMAARRGLRGRSRLTYIVAPSALAVLVLGGVAAYLTLGGGPGVSASGAQHAAATGSASAAPSSRSTTVIPPGGQSGTTALAALGSSAIIPPGSAKTTVESWNKGHGGTNLSAISGQIGAVTQAIGLRQYVAAKASCKVLAGEVRTAQAGPPIPYQAMQKLYKVALSDLAAGAADCQAAISQKDQGDEYIQTSVSKAKMAAATADLKTGAKDLYRSTAAIEATGQKR
ncbi:MAG TPA: hypothetical protein VGG16_11500 [Streptosporangiaceae bacterium]